MLAKNDDVPPETKDKIKEVLGQYPQAKKKFDELAAAGPSVPTSTPPSLLGKGVGGLGQSRGRGGPRPNPPTPFPKREGGTRHKTNRRRRSP